MTYARVFQEKRGEQERGLNIKRVSRDLVQSWTWLTATAHSCGSTAFNSISVYLIAILRDVSAQSKGRVIPKALITISLADGIHFGQSSGDICFSLSHSLRGGRRHSFLVGPRNNKGNFVAILGLLGRSIRTCEPWALLLIAESSSRRVEPGVSSQLTHPRRWRGPLAFLWLQSASTLDNRWCAHDAPTTLTHLPSGVRLVPYTVKTQA